MEKWLPPPHSLINFLYWVSSHILFYIQEIPSIMGFFHPLQDVVSFALILKGATYGGVGTWVTVTITTRGMTLQKQHIDLYLPVKMIVQNHYPYKGDWKACTKKIVCNGLNRPRCKTPFQNTFCHYLYALQNFNMWTDSQLSLR